MNKVIFYKQVSIIMSIVFFISCKPVQNTTQKKEEPNYPIEQVTQIGLNDIKVEGLLIKELGKDYFVVKRVMLRGRSAPVIANEQKLLIKNIKIKEVKRNQLIIATLNAKQATEESPIIWILKQ